MTATREPARQPERTRLAWRRTLLAATAVGLLTIRFAGREGQDPPRLLAAAVAVAAWLAVLVVSYRRIAAMATARPVPVGRAVPLTALIVAGYAGLGIALVATGPR